MRATKRKRKRPCYRVICLGIAEVERTYLLGLYAKGEKADLSPDEKKILKGLVERLKREAL